VTREPLIQKTFGRDTLPSMGDIAIDPEVERPELPAFPLVGPTGSKITRFTGFVEVLPGLPPETMSLLAPHAAARSGIEWLASFRCEDGTHGTMAAKGGQWTWHYRTPPVVAPGEAP
jgi:hypothetical protein